MKIQITKDIARTCDDIFYYAHLVDSNGKVVEFLYCDLILEKLYEKVERWKKKKQSKPEIIKEIEL